MNLEYADEMKSGEGQEWGILEMGNSRPLSTEFISETINIRGNLPTYYRTLSLTK